VGDLLGAQGSGLELRLLRNLPELVGRREESSLTGSGSNTRESSASARERGPKRQRTAHLPDANFEPVLAFELLRGGSDLLWAFASDRGPEFRSQELATGDGLHRAVQEPLRAAREVHASALTLDNVGLGHVGGDRLSRLDRH
jgi:hypothetical protein